MWAYFKGRFLRRALLSREFCHQRSLCRIAGHFNFGMVRSACRYSMILVTHIKYMKSNRAWLVYVFASVLVLISVAYFVTSYDESDLGDSELIDTHHIGGAVMLSPSELSSKKALAEGGDGRAAYLVFQHYAFGLGEEDVAEHWLDMSADAGYAHALEAKRVLGELRQHD